MAVRLISKLKEELRRERSRRILFMASIAHENQFGLPYKDHQQEMQINIFDGYAIFAIQEREKAAAKDGRTPQLHCNMNRLPC